ncbi:hypothetical protein QJQ45_017678 [Haematococcus lacustris]|nr:hypothetical protein QJQ45_017678 [Haematococcus lacustris]
MYHFPLLHYQVTEFASAIDPARLMPPTGLNLKNAGVKRILQEIKEVQADTSGDFIAEALEDDIFEWHFVIRGPADSEFEGGVYHGRILLPAEYPFKPPGFMMLTPSGRFETGVKICLTISSYHPEQWQPSWSVRTALTALVAFMPTPAGSAVGSLDYTKEERRALAIKSRTTIPKFGSAERQRITDEMHARMLALPTPQARLLSFRVHHSTRKQIFLATAAAQLEQAIVMAKLSGHKNILSMHAIAFAGAPGKETDGYMLLDYCPSTLLEAMQKASFMLDDFFVYEVFSEVCQAVAHMHRQKPPLAHRYSGSAVSAGVTGKRSGLLQHHLKPQASIGAAAIARSTVAGEQQLGRQGVWGARAAHQRQPVWVVAALPRDIKAENVLRSSDGRWVLCDFGSVTDRAQVYSSPAEVAMEEEVIRRTTTPAYRRVAPEMWDLLSRQLVDTKVDIWALGVLLYVLVFGKLPFPGDSKLSVLFGKYELPAGHNKPQVLCDLVRILLTTDPAQRPDIVQVLSLLESWRKALTQQAMGHGSRPGQPLPAAPGPGPLPLSSPAPAPAPGQVSVAPGAGASAMHANGSVAAHQVRPGPATQQQHVSSLPGRQPDLLGSSSSGRQQHPGQSPPQPGVSGVQPQPQYPSQPPYNQAAPPTHHHPPFHPHHQPSQSLPHALQQPQPPHPSHNAKPSLGRLSPSFQPQHSPGPHPAHATPGPPTRPGHGVGSQAQLPPPLAAPPGLASAPRTTDTLIDLAPPIASPTGPAGGGRLAATLSLLEQEQSLLPSAVQGGSSSSVGGSSSSAAVPQTGSGGPAAAGGARGVGRTSGAGPGGLMAAMLGGHHRRGSSMGKGVVEGFEPDWGEQPAWGPSAPPTQTAQDATASPAPHQPLPHLPGSSNAAPGAAATPWQQQPGSSSRRGTPAHSRHSSLMDGSLDMAPPGSHAPGGAAQTPSSHLDFNALRVQVKGLMTSHNSLLPRVRQLEEAVAHQAALITQQAALIAQLQASAAIRLVDEAHGIGQQGYQRDAEEGRSEGVREPMRVCHHSPRSCCAAGGSPQAPRPLRMAQHGAQGRQAAKLVGAWKPPAGQVEQRLVRPAWSQECYQPVRGLMWCPLVAPRKPPQAPRSSQAATPAAASEPGPSTPPPAKRSKPAAEPTKGTGKGKAQGKAAKAKPAPQPGRWLDRDCNAALNMQRIGESRWRPLELCFWPDQGALPAKGKEYPGLGYKRLRDKPPKAQQQQQQPAEAQ